MDEMKMKMTRHNDQTIHTQTHSQSQSHTLAHKTKRTKREHERNENEHSNITQQQRRTATYEEKYEPPTADWEEIIQKKANRRTFLHIILLNSCLSLCFCRPTWKWIELMTDEWSVGMSAILLIPFCFRFVRSGFCFFFFFFCWCAASARWNCERDAQTAITHSERTIDNWHMKCLRACTYSQSVSHSNVGVCVRLMSACVDLRYSTDDDDEAMWRYACVWTKKKKYWKSVYMRFSSISLVQAPSLSLSLARIFGQFVLHCAVVPRIRIERNGKKLWKKNIFFWKKSTFFLILSPFLPLSLPATQTIYFFLLHFDYAVQPNRIYRS